MPTGADARNPKQKAVLDGVIQRLSVSQIEGFDPRTPFGCMRKWWFKYVAGIPEPQSSATQVGTQLHSEIERFLKDGEQCLSRLALSGRQYIDEVANEEVRLIEHHFDGQVTVRVGDREIPLVGYIDVVMPTRPEILDWKTTADIEKWAKTAAQLRKSTQMVGYAKWFFGRYKQFDAVTLTHVYFQTRGTPDSRKRSCAITIPDVEEQWSDVERTVRAMVDVAKAPDPSKVPGTFDHKCYRCPYRGICPPAPLHPGEQEDIMSLLGVFDDEKPASVSAAPPDTAAAGDKMEGQPAPVKEEGAKSGDPVENFTTSTAETLAKMDDKEKGLEVPAPGEGTKRKRGRPAGSKNKDTTPATGAVFSTLLINCIPAGDMEAAMGDRYVRGLCAKLEEPLGTHDLRIPPADPELAKKWDAACGFGRWKGSLQALVRANPPEVETLILQVTDEVGKCVAEALAPLAAVVIRPLGGA